MTGRSVELGLAAIIALVSIVLATTAPRFFDPSNLSDILLANLPVLVAALGATLVILTGEIDISVGSAFAICSVVAGTMAAAGLPLAAVLAGAIAAGLAIGTINGLLVAYAGIPSIVVTLALMIALRDGLRWVTEGAWVQGLPADFQWLGLSQSMYPVAAFGFVALVTIALAWLLAETPAGRSVYATGSSAGAARLAGLDVAAVRFSVFVAAGAFTAVAALLNTARFTQVPTNTGLNLEMKVIAAVVVGGAAITGGRGTVVGTVLGVVLLGISGPALTFLGASAYWERALQGAIILAAVASHAAGRLRRPTTQPARHLAR